MWPSTAFAQKVSAKDKGTYKDRNLPTPSRVDMLLAQMTVDEKIGQMTQLCASSITLDGTKSLDLNIDKIRAFIINENVGSFLSGTGNEARWKAFLKGVQEVAVKESRLGIPVIFGIDHVHGNNYVDEGTLMPHNINLSCTFDDALMAKVGTQTAKEQLPMGMAWNFAPVCDVARNPAWPRHYESFGEDPLLCGRMAASFITGFEGYEEKGYRQAACAKHFIGYSDPKSGWDRTPSEIPEQVIWERYVPPFQAAIAAGVKTLMVNSGELNGEPLHASRYWLTEVLRKRLGFEGVILTDIKDILKVVEMHGTAKDEKEATALCINAGIDMSMACSSTDFVKLMKKLVIEGQVPMARIDEATKRILKLKFDLGLFENPYPFVEKKSRYGQPEAKNIAYEAAAKSIVLLENPKALLPLKATGGKKLLVAGHGANSKRILNGPWTLEWLGAEEARQPKDMLTLFSALKQSADFETVLSTTANKSADSAAMLVAFAKEVEAADQVVLTLGEQPYSEFKGNIGDLALDAYQAKLLEIAAKKPTIVVLLEGRPRVLPKYMGPNVAVVYAGIPGQAGGTAIADVLLGKQNPSGKLSFTYPASTGHFVTYDHKKSDKYVPRYAFGHGLSYTTYTYNNIEIAGKPSLESPKVQLKMEVANTGSRDGEEVVLVYGQDVVGTLTRPVRKLVAYKRIGLKAGERMNLTFDIDMKAAFAFPDKNGKSQFEAGDFNLMVGGQTLPITLK